MKLFRAFLLLALIGMQPAICFGANWLYVGDSSKAVVYMDTSSILTIAGGYKAWIRWEYTITQKVGYPPKDALSAKELDYFRCGEKTFAQVQQVFYEGKNSSGDSVFSSIIAAPYIQYTDVIPETLGESILNDVCAFGDTVYKLKSKSP